MDESTGAAPQTVNVAVGWWHGPENAVDRLAYSGLDAREIAHRLDLPLWLVVERFRQLTEQGALRAVAS